MSRFVLKYLKDGKPNRNRPEETVDRERIVVGSRPLADVYANDRLVAQEAAALRFDGSRLTLEVLDDFAGIFVDGVPVTGRGPVPEKAAIQMGHLLLEPTVDAAKGTCHITVSENHLSSAVDWFVRQEKPERPFSLESSGPQEHLWGKSPVLRRANLAALALGAAALLAFPLLRDTETVTRGALAPPHRPGAAEGSPAGCADCHAPLSSDYAPKCAKCHEPFADPAFHPYDAGSHFSCAACHREHRGEAEDLVPDLAAAAADGEWPALCARCHAPMPVRTPRAVRDRPAPSEPRVLLVDGFSHADHLAADGRPAVAGVPTPPSRGKLPVDCATCHRRAEPEAAAAPSPAAAEFGAVPYEGCLDCHATWAVPVHGRDEGGRACLQCHAPAASPGAIGKDLRTVELAATGSRFVLVPRGHDFRSDECLKCHTLARAAPDGRLPVTEKVFRHDHHLERVPPAAGTGMAVSARCQECHRSVAGSEGLAGVPLADPDACVRCHTDGAPVPVADPAAGTRTVPDMFHRVHVLDFAEAAAIGSAGTLARRDSLRAGCLSCHEPVAGEGPMRFREGTKDCASCHTRHENTGGGRCALCHLDRDHEGNRDDLGRVRYRFNERGIFDPARATAKPRGAVAGFDHFSPGHRGGGCAACHDATSVAAADRVAAVPLPAPDAPACVGCHQRTRYHR